MDATTPAPTPSSAATGEDKTVAIVSYLTLIGFIAAVIIHSNKKTKLGSYHLRQMLGYMLTGLVIAFGQIVLLMIPILGWLAIVVIWISMLVFWIMGLVAAIKGEMKPMPLVGPLYQKWFGNTFE
jgi:uncharacterized membrane protein